MVQSTLQKLIVQIPCFNEEGSIAQVIESIPKKIKGISKIIVVVLDDGSFDQTTQVARNAGADVIITGKRKLGLAKIFYVGLRKAFELEGDIIVNIDGDNQYDPGEIPSLIAPILDKRGDLVIGDRQIDKRLFLSFVKRHGNIFGSWVVRALTGCQVRDASSGFRAFTSDCARQLVPLSDHTYTHETLIQAHDKGFVICEIPITFRQRQLGQSRLIINIFSHVFKSAEIIIRLVLMYRAFKLLVTTGFVIISVGIVSILRFLYFFVIGEGKGHIQSLIIASVFITLGVNILLLGVIADLIMLNRKLLERGWWPQVR